MALYWPEETKRKSVREKCWSSHKQQYWSNNYLIFLGSSPHAPGPVKRTTWCERESSASSDDPLERKPSNHCIVHVASTIRATGGVVEVLWFYLQHDIHGARERDQQFATAVSDWQRVLCGSFHLCAGMSMPETALGDAYASVLHTVLQSSHCMHMHDYACGLHCPLAEVNLYSTCCNGEHTMVWIHWMEYGGGCISEVC